MVEPNRGARGARASMLGRYLPLAVLAVGAVLRIVWLIAQTPANRLSIGEAMNVARSIAEHNLIGDVFRAGGGPTAHVMPLSPLAAAGAYKLLGVQTAAAEAVLTVWSLALVFASFWLLNRTFARLGTPLVHRLAALAVLCVVPLNFSLETVWFRVWEGGLAVALASLFLYLLVVWDGTPVRWRRMAGAALLFALLAFVSPNFGLAGGVAAAIFMVRNLPPRRWPVQAVFVVLAMALVFGPWALRNQAELGSPILLRSNAGLEMALAFHDEAATTSDPRGTFFRRHQAIHPFEQGPGYAALQRAGGEVAYARQLGSETQRWMAAHPADAARLAVRHVVEMLFPPAWYWTQFSDRSSGTTIKLAANWLISAGGLIGIVLMLGSGDGRRFYAPVMTLVTILPYALVQPTLRYRYLIFALLVFFCADAAARLIRRFRAREGVTA